MMSISTTRKVARRPRGKLGKKLTLPNQAMSLAEMFRRFVRREPLPGSAKAAVYVESDYDLEKIKHMDILEKEDILMEMKEKTSHAESKVKKRQKEVADEQAAIKEAEKLKQSDPKETSPPKAL